jgi:alpha,alpha-trehalase
MTLIIPGERLGDTSAPNGSGELSLAPSPERLAPTYYHDAQTMINPRTGKPLFDDSMTRADRSWQRPLPEIEQDYLVLRTDSDITTNPDTMRRFEDRNFGPVPPADNQHIPDGGSADEYVEKMWYDGLYADLSAYRPDHGPEGGSSLILDNQMADFPMCGGRYGNRKRPTHFGWDPRFIQVGLIADGHWQLSRNLVHNHRRMIMRDGFVRNGNRTYYRRPQLPEFAMMVRQQALHDGPEVLVENLPAMEREYATWMEGADNPEKLRAGACRSARLMDDGVSILNALWDLDDGPRLEGYREDIHTASEAAKLGYTSDKQFVYKSLRHMCVLGHDMTTRGMADKTLASADAADKIFMEPQARLYTLEETIRDAYRLKATTAPTLELRELFWMKSLRMQANMDARFAAVQKYLVNHELGFGFDYNTRERRQTDIWSSGGNAALLETGLFTRDQGKRAIGWLKRRFSKPGGLMSTLDTEVPHNWVGDKAWSFIEWSAARGAERYGDDEAAHTWPSNWEGSQEKVHDEFGIMAEKTSALHPGKMAGGEGEGVEYHGKLGKRDVPCVVGFGPTNGVFAAFRHGAHRRGRMRELVQEAVDLRTRYPDLPHQMGLRALRLHAAKN